MGRNSSEPGNRCRFAPHRTDDATASTSKITVWLLAALLALTAPARAALVIERATLHQFEDGPILPASHVFLPGEPIYFACRLNGYQPLEDPKDESRSVKLNWQIEVTDPSGTALVPAASGLIAEPLFRQDKDWRPKFLKEFTIPPFAPPGKYRIRVAATDEVAKSSASTEMFFDVRGHTVEPSAEIIARNLHFLHSEEDGPPLNPVAYHPGETLWARFDITGFGYEKKPDGKDAKSRFSVEYGLAVLKETGDQVFAQPAAAADTAETFYPQRYVPGALSLTLDPKVPMGNYILLITMEDKVTGKKAEARGGFRVW